MPKNTSLKRTAKFRNILPVLTRKPKFWNLLKSQKKYCEFDENPCSENSCKGFTHDFSNGDIIVEISSNGTKI